MGGGLEKVLWGCIRRKWDDAKTRDTRKAMHLVGLGGRPGSESLQEVSASEVPLRRNSPWGSKRRSSQLGRPRASKLEMREKDTG